MGLISKKDRIEEIRNLGRISPEDCEALKGQLNEDGECLIRRIVNPDDPDIVVLGSLNYRPSAKRETE